MLVMFIHINIPAEIFIFLVIDDFLLLLLLHLISNLFEVLRASEEGIVKIKTILESFHVVVVWEGALVLKMWCWDKDRYFDLLNDFLNFLNRDRNLKNWYYSKISRAFGEFLL